MEDKQPKTIKLSTAIYLIIIFILIVIIFGILFYYNNKNNDSANIANTTESNSVSKIEETNTVVNESISTTEENISNNTINTETVEETSTLSDKLISLSTNGQSIWHWFDDTNPDIPEYEIIISDITDDKMTFDFTIYRIVGFEEQIATFNEDTASFSMGNDSDGSTIEGTFELYGDNLVMNITHIDTNDLYSMENTISFELSDESVLE